MSIEWRKEHRNHVIIFWEKAYSQLSHNNSETVRQILLQKLSELIYTWTGWYFMKVSPPGVRISAIKWLIEVWLLIFT